MEIDIDEVKYKKGLGIFSLLKVREIQVSITKQKIASKHVISC